ncbi:ABC transporter permease [Oleispirillum naphthae]|uniref:ABC transporter permease n=1 Tax=Oleispirillum naphthae TaxID=2838853 RepID=UPI0030824230
MIRFILADLRRLWAGSLVVVLLVALATALGVAVSLQERALRLGSARAAAKFDLIVGAPGSATQLVLSAVFLQPAPLPLVSGETLAKLTADPRVAWAAPIGFGDFYAGNPIVGTTTTLVAETGRGFAAGRMFAREGEAVTGAAVDLALGAEIVPVHGRPGAGGHRHGDVRYRVVGHLKPTGTAWDRAILVPVQAVWHVHGLGHHDEHEHDEHEEHEHHHGIDADAPLTEHWDAEDAPGLPAILVKPRSVAAAYKLRQDYRGDRTQAVFPAEVLTALYATMGDARRILFAIAVGAQALVAASLVLVTVIHVAQRKRQIGALRAFGAPRRAVFLIVWLELFTLVATGIAAGFAIGYAVSQALAAAFAAENGIVLPVGFTAEDVPFALGLAGFAALLAALPAALAYREPPAQALRG